MTFTVEHATKASMSWCLVFQVFQVLLGDVAQSMVQGMRQINVITSGLFTLNLKNQ